MSFVGSELLRGVVDVQHLVEKLSVLVISWIKKRQANRFSDEMRPTLLCICEASIDGGVVASQNALECLFVEQCCQRFSTGNLFEIGIAEVDEETVTIVLAA